MPFQDLIHKLEALRTPLPADDLDPIGPALRDVESGIDSLSDVNPLRLTGDVERILVSAARLFEILQKIENIRISEESLDAVQLVLLLLRRRSNETIAMQAAE